MTIHNAESFRLRCYALATIAIIITLTLAGLIPDHGAFGVAVLIATAVMVGPTMPWLRKYRRGLNTSEGTTPPEMR